MSASDPELARLVSRWVEKAERDLRLAELALAQAEPCPFDLVCYHAQQCAEKYLKSYLVARQVEFPYTHDLRVLTGMIEGELGTGPFCRQAGALTVYESRTRYPYDAPDPDRAEALRALELAREVRQAVISLLCGEGFNVAG
jgi:HEPN domain-containing protein